MSTLPDAVPPELPIAAYGTLVIETTFVVAGGAARVTDALVFAEGQRGHDVDLEAPHELVRLVEGLDGLVDFDLELSLRLEYGLGRPRSQPTAARDVAARISDTVEAWRSWEAEHDVYQGPRRELVRLSSRVLKGLTYRPTGAIVAAPTTSLPEAIGGVRNWDYRYSWIRDASLTLDALWIGTCSDEVGAFVSWMTGAAYGEFLDAYYRYADRLPAPGEHVAHFLADLADTAAARWPERGAGIWEARAGPRHYLSGKLYCWVALDRAVRLAPRIGAEEHAPRWAHERDRVRDAILS